jgi:hypothetical protein
MKPHAQLARVLSDKQPASSASGNPHFHLHLHNHAADPQHGPSQLELLPDIIMAITHALGQNIPNATSTHAGPSSSKRFFSKAITTTTSDIPISVIKELRGGFKNYISLALCTHKACQNATHSSDHINTEIGWTEKGKMRLKQKSMNASRDHFLKMDDFAEIRKNFIRGIHKYLIMAHGR